MKTRRLLLTIPGAILFLVIGYIIYNRYYAPTKVALVHFPAYQVSNFVHANKDRHIRVEEVSEEKASRLPHYDAILIFGAGFRPTPEQNKAIEKAQKRGIPIYSYVMRSDRIQNFNITENQEEVLNLYYKYRSKQNYANLLRYIRQELDPHKKSGEKAVPPQILPEDLFYHLDDNHFFLSVNELEEYLKESGQYVDSAPKLALLSGTLAPLEGNRAHVDTLISGLMQRGYNVYPFISTSKRLEMLEAIQPDGLIYIPMGRLASNTGDEWLKAHNVPIFSPFPINQTEERWLEDQIGLTAGSLTARISLVELDGGLLPIPIAIEDMDNDGLVSILPQKEGITQFMDNVNRHMKLRTQRNTDKRVAIVYFRGPGNSALHATGLEVIPSLYNFLKRLKDEGYNVNGLPNTLQEFSDDITARGAIWGDQSPERQAHFIAKQDPVLVTVSDYENWVKKMIAPSKYQEVVDLYGPAPGSYMNTLTSSDEQAIAIARIQYGNVVLLPQQVSSFTEDQFKMVHGVELPPPHSYLAPYLWIQEGFKADALIHFGTHGNLEFTPGKQVALSHLDWANALIGSLPHFYYYSISNVGESVIAKRRSHAGIVSYLTPPFLESNTRKQYEQLFQLLEQVRMTGTEAIGLKFKKECICLNLHQDLQLDNDLSRPYSEDEVIYIERFLEEISNEKMTGKLYILGETYTPREIEGTVVAMSADAIAYQWARLDKHLGRISQKDYENRTFISTQYLRPLTGLIRQHFADNNSKAIISKVASNGTPSDSIGMVLLGELQESIEDLFTYKDRLLTSPTVELDALVSALNGGYIAPGPGGDAVRSPDALPTGRNLFSINAENTPTEKAWNTGQDLARRTIQNYLDEHGKYPNKISYTFWAGEFIESEGATIAQVLAMIGVEPIRDRNGRVVDLRLIPAEELGRPRIDVAIQVSGQLRDLATSRLVLLNRAIEMAAAATDDSEHNFVRAGSIDVERRLIEKGTPPADARALADMRIFGGLNGRYGTGIKELVEDGDSWNDRSEIARTYMKNMGAIYGKEESWGEYHEYLLEAVLQNTDVVVQPRQNNTWGALSLDHMYEFMGGISNAIEDVTGNAPETYLADYRNRFNPRMQELKEAIGVESRTTLFNPEYIKEKMKGGASTANTFAKTIRNSYGWATMKRDVLSDEWWDQLYDIYIKDRHNLGIRDYFEGQNPAALQEITAVMLETARKELWNASDEQIKNLAELHGALTIQFGASGSDFTESNAKLQDFIAQNLSTSANDYKNVMSGQDFDPNKKSLVLEEQRVSRKENQSIGVNRLIITNVVVAFVLLVLVIIVRRSRQK